jgi:hypothetical protein
MEDRIILKRSLSCTTPTPTDDVLGRTNAQTCPGRRLLLFVGITVVTERRIPPISHRMIRRDDKRERVPIQQSDDDVDRWRRRQKGVCKAEKGRVSIQDWLFAGLQVQYAVSSVALLRLGS